MQLKHDPVRPVWWEDHTCVMIDQRALPTTYSEIHCTTPEAVAEAIQTMVIRGAPAIGVAAAFGMALAALQSVATTKTELLDDLQKAKQTLDRARPTAVNLSWATTRMVRSAERLEIDDIASIKERLVELAQAIRDEDEAMCRAIGEHGASLLQGHSTVLTHCNAGGLATSAYGTALAPIRRAVELGTALHVYVDETRPFLQGARLTAWELQQAKIDYTLITDSMAGHFMQRGAIECIVVGADRIAANGDVANKIGTYSLAVLAQAHGIPLYVAAPTSTIDLATADGAHIPIEERSSDEVTSLAGIAIAPSGARAAHPAFDITPARLVSAIITEQGIARAPYSDTLRTAVEAAQGSAV